MMVDVAENLDRVRKTLAKVCPDPQSIQVLAVTKFQPFERVEAAIKAGIKLLGVNYVQAGSELRKHFSNYPLEWHFIGHIQSRKAKLIADYDCIESLDRIEVASLLNDQLKEKQKTLSVLVEVNIGAEPNKSGVFPERLGSFLTDLRRFERIEIKGLMCLPPPHFPTEKRRPYFKEMSRLYHKFQSEFPFQTLSMGTSDDFSIAVEEGANLIRLGVVLFGQRTD